MREFETSIYKMDPLPPMGTCLFNRNIKPSEQTFIEMIRLTLMPYFALYSFTFFYLILILFVFCYSLSWQSQGYSSSQHVEIQFLSVSQKALFELGENYPYYIVKKYHYYRMLTSMVLFRNFYHFVICVLGIGVCGSYIEEWIGFKRVFVLTVTSGVTGEMFGNLVQDQAKLESFTPICGMVGYLIGVYVMHCRKQWRHFENEKNHMLIILGGFLGLMVYLSFLYTNICIYSQMAGLIFGFIFYFTDDKHEEFGIKSVCVIILVSGIVGVLSFLFFFYSDPQRVYR